MRVVAGSAKGVRLAPVPRGVRPVSDMAREGVFSSLGDRVEGARVLDLYSGTGAMGIEALSRGAAHAVLVERDRGALRAIRENLERTRLSDSAEVAAVDVVRFVTRDGEPAERFDLVFADPPYDAPTTHVEGLLAGLVRGWLSVGGRLVLTRPTRSSTLVIPVHFSVARRLTYGDTLVLIIREA